VKSLKLDKRMTIGLIIGGDILLLALGWMLLVSPQRQAAASIGKATQAATAQIADAQSQAQLAAHPVIPKQPEIKTAGLYELAKAMPSVTDMPDLLLELDQVARASGVSVITISPGPPAIVPTEPWSTVTIQLALSGNYYSLTDLLYRLRTLVAVNDGALETSGRLFTVDMVTMTTAGGSALSATVTVDAYIYGAGGSSSAVTDTPASTDTTSTGSSTPSTTTSSSSDVAP
jgi:type IV pilus assembly protein PilO